VGVAPAESSSTDVLLEVIRTLQAQLAAQQHERESEREAERAERSQARQEIARLVSMVEGLTRQLDELLRDRDEERRVELARELEAVRAAVAALDPATAANSNDGSPDAAGITPTSAKAPRKRHAHGRAPRPPNVPREPRTLRPAACDQCGGKRLEDGPHTEPTEEWDFVRAYLRIRSTTRCGCTCEDCGALTPAPPAAPMPFDRASCTFALMAWLCFTRCGLFLPLDRLQRDFAAQGVPIPSAMLTRWWQRGADLLLPVAAAVRLSLLADTHVRMDGTGLKVIFPRVKGAPRKGSRRPGETDDEGFLPARQPLDGQILVFGNDEHAVYTFTPTREGYHALDFFTVGEDAEGHPIRWRGTITADALSAQDCLYEGGTRTETGCNAHGLRKFRDEADKAPLLASRAMAFIGRIYDVEATAKSAGLRGPALLAHRHFTPSLSSRTSACGWTRTSPTCCRRTPSARRCSTTSTTGRR
jgi:transposase